MPEPSESVVHHAGGALTRKIGPLPLVAWVGILSAGVFVLRLVRGRSSSAAATANPAAPMGDPLAMSNTGMQSLTQSVEDQTTAINSLAGIELNGEQTTQGLLSQIVSGLQDLKPPPPTAAPTPVANPIASPAPTPKLWTWQGLTGAMFGALPVNPGYGFDVNPYTVTPQQQEWSYTVQPGDTWQTIASRYLTGTGGSWLAGGDPAYALAQRNQWAQLSPGATVALPYAQWAPNWLTYWQNTPQAA